MKKMLEEDNIIPFELELEIIKRLPVESLIRFRSVSKAWKSLIDSSDFIADYSSKVQHLLVSCRHHGDHDNEYVLFVDDHNFPQQRVSPATPELVKLKTFQTFRIIGSSRGLLCLHGYCSNYPFPSTEVVVLWNVSIRKVVYVVLPNYNNRFDMADVGFGVCSKTNDPKIVDIRDICMVPYPESIRSCRPRLKVEIFILSTGEWRRLYNNLPRKSVCIMRRQQVVIDGFIYWLAKDKIAAMDGGFRYLIISFDLTSEEFGEVNLPDTLARVGDFDKLKVSRIRKSLVVIERDDRVGRDSTFFVWMMMQDGNSNSFTKLFDIHTPDVLTLDVLEFRKSGEPILHIAEHGYSWTILCDSRIAAYEPDSKHICNLGIDGKCLTFYASSYMETLLLHDQPNFIVYDKGGVSNFYEWRSDKSRVHITS